MSEPCLYPCPDCPFGGPRVGGKGDPNSRLIVIGESPGTQELRAKAPFVGPSGKVLDTGLAQGGYHDEPYIINALQCYPGNASEKNSETLSRAVIACRQHMLDEIAKAPRDVILALGSPALWATTNNHDLRITFDRGKIFPSELCKMGIVPSVHPAFLMRGGSGSSTQQFMRDVKYATDLIKGGSPKRPPDVQYEFARDERDIKDLAEYFRSFGAQHVIAGDIETTGLSFLSHRILCMGFAPTAEEVYGIPEHLSGTVGPLFDNDARFIWHNGKFDVKFLWQYGIKRARIDEDSMLMSYVLDETGGIHDLETVASDWLGSPNWKGVLDQYLPKKKKKKDPNSYYELIPRDVLHHYMCLDIGNTRGLYDVLRPKIAADKNLEKAYTKTLIPAANFLARVERRGMHADLERIAQNKDWYGERISGYQADFFEFAKKFPESGYTEKLMNSPKQMSRLLYDDLKIPLYKKSRSTAADILEKLPRHVALDLLGKSRKDNKEYGTYVKNVLENVDSDGNVHTSYAQHGTRTGRLASKQPNVQNVPRNPRIRGQYIARSGRRFLEPDLNQAELRALACFSSDKTLCHIYETAGMSLHDELRADIWGYAKDWSASQLEKYLRKYNLTEDTRWGAKGEDRIIEEQKMRAKAVNFGIVYGREAFSIAEEFQIDPKEAQIWINAWFKKFPQAKKFLDVCRDAPVKGQVLVNNFGFKRRFGVVGNERLKGMQNEASNFPPQSCASHITVHAGMEVEDCLREKFDSHICNLVHDSLLIDVPDDDAVANEVALLVIAKMEEVPTKWGFTRIPFVAEAKMGYRWGSLSKFSPKPIDRIAA